MFQRKQNKTAGATSWPQFKPLSDFQFASTLEVFESICDERWFMRDVGR